MRAGSRAVGSDRQTQVQIVTLYYNLVLMGLVALISLLSYSITICKMGVRIVPTASDCWEAMHGKGLLAF